MLCRECPYSLPCLADRLSRKAGLCPKCGRYAIRVEDPCDLASVGLNDVGGLWVLRPKYYVAFKCEMRVAADLVRNTSKEAISWTIRDPVGGGRSNPLIVTPCVGCWAVAGATITDLDEEKEEAEALAQERTLPAFKLK